MGKTPGNCKVVIVTKIKVWNQKKSCNMKKGKKILDTKV